MTLVEKESWLRVGWIPPLDNQECYIVQEGLFNF